MKTNADDFLQHLSPLEPRFNETRESMQARAQAMSKAIQEHPPLTKRELFAAFAMQGFIATGLGKSVVGKSDPKGNCEVQINLDQIGNASVKMSDTLIQFLNKKEEPQNANPQNQ